ncbi:hypothetical protein EJ04DRAFT_556665 [Polyplosphaeria fusca]|uniref:Uncharacterized protein n=1 Tax=Polyplosphaeria fusca TaxID=682080 RepID=A0A9P4QPL5_9PLEO|nr:hypothetical protein EJ04DRAFT_556665 [Polyplosphaeria fusca]
MAPTFLFLLALLPTLIAAYPQSTDLTPRSTVDGCETAGVFICEHVNWGGACTHSIACVGGAPDACTKLDGKASSIGPDKGFKCLFYKSDDCLDVPGPSGGVLDLRWPGTGNLFNVNGGNWNDIIRSYQCYQE